MRNNLTPQDWNEYGFIGTVRYGASILFEGAMQWAGS
jgi:hypothetical protein